MEGQVRLAGVDSAEGRENILLSLMRPMRTDAASKPNRR